MKFVVLFSISLILTLTSCIRGEKADLIVHNAVIYSVDENFTVYEAMAIKDGIIIDMGKENQILNKYSSDNIYDAKKSSIFPGFIDAHCHFLGYGLSLQQVDLNNVLSMEEMVSRCEIFQKEHPSSNGWIVGRGWNNNLWENNNFPSNELLTKAFPDTPVLLRRIDGHGALANQKALDLAGIVDTTKIAGGHIEILEGKITGMLMDNAVDMVLSKIPSPTENEKRKAILDAQKNCFEVGLTTVDDAGIDKADVFLLEKMEKSGELLMNIYVMLSDNKVNIDYFLDTIGQPYRTNKINVAGFKFYSDGAMGSKSACLTKPYYDTLNPTNVGFLLKNKSYFDEMAERLYAAKFQMCTHAIGDSAVKIILDSYGKVLKETNDKRWRIEHAQMVDPIDFVKFKTFSIIPSVQPTHATSDMMWVIKLLGDKRIKNSYAYRELLIQNGMIALGTDFPIERINPIETFYAAVARKNRNGHPKNGFQIENALTREEALKGMTIWAALANFEEKIKGSLEIGKRADFVVLNNDLMTCLEEDILKTFVTATFIDGKSVYE
jgi:predicted amidohydrolase YtcJ